MAEAPTTMTTTPMLDVPDLSPWLLVSEVEPPRNTPCWIWGRALHGVTIGLKLPRQRYWVADGTLWLAGMPNF